MAERRVTFSPLHPEPKTETMTKQKPPPDNQAWLHVGVQAIDGHSGRVGVVQLLSDELGTLETGPIESPTRALLRPTSRSYGVPWWAAVGDLTEVEQ